MRALSHDSVSFNAQSSQTRSNVLDRLTATMKFPHMLNQQFNREKSKAVFNLLMSIKHTRRCHVTSGEGLKFDIRSDWV